MGETVWESGSKSVQNLNFEFPRHFWANTFFPTYLGPFHRRKRDMRLGSIPNVLVATWSDPTKARTNMQLVVQVKLAEEEYEERIFREEQDRRV